MEMKHIERNKDTYAELIQFLNDKSLSLIMREASDNRREALAILRDHSTGKRKPSIISFYTELTSVKREPNESVTDYIRTEATLTGPRNARESLSDGQIIALVLNELADYFIPFQCMQLIIIRNKCSQSLKHNFKVLKILKNIVIIDGNIIKWTNVFSKMISKESDIKQELTCFGYSGKKNMAKTHLNNYNKNSQCCN